LRGRPTVSTRNSHRTTQTAPMRGRVAPPVATNPRFEEARGGKYSPQSRGTHRWWEKWRKWTMPRYLYGAPREIRTPDLLIRSQGYWDTHSSPKLNRINTLTKRRRAQSLDNLVYSCCFVFNHLQGCVSHLCHTLRHTLCLTKCCRLATPIRDQHRAHTQERPPRGRPWGPSLH